MIVFVLFLLLPASDVFGRSENPFVIGNEMDGKAAGKHIDYLFDESDRLTIADITAPAHAGKFRRASADNPSFGYSRHPLWIRLTTSNPTGHSMRWYLDFAYPLIDHIDFYYHDGASYQAIETGDRHPFESRPVRYRTFVFPVKQDPGEQTFYLRLRSQGSLTVHMSAYSERCFASKIETESIALWLYYGVMLALILYNLFIMASVREASYFYLVVFTVAISLYSMAHNGLGFQYLWPHAVWWANISHPVLSAVSSASSLQFTRAFLSVRRSAPRLNMVFTIFIGISLVFTPLPLFLPYYYSTQISTVLIASSAAIMIFSAAYMAIKGSPQARIFLLAWTFFLVTVSIAALRAFGIGTGSFIVNWGYQIGSSLLVLLLSLGISNKINLMRREREQALIELHKSEEQYRFLVENAHEGILLLVDSKVAYANRALLSMTGFDSSEFYAFDFFNDLFPDTEKGKRLVYQNYIDRIEGRIGASQYEAQVRTREGKIIDVIISATPIQLEDKTGSLCIITDISRVKEAEKTIKQQYEEIQSQYTELEAMNEVLVETQDELTESNALLSAEKEQLATTLRAIGDAVITTDRNGNVLLINEAAEHLTGYSRDEAINRRCGEIVRFMTFSGHMPFDPVNAILQSGGLGESGGQLLLVNRRGEERIIEIQGSTIRNYAREVSGTVLAMRDITEKYKLEQEILKMSKIESLGVLAGGIAHDFNNLLTAITGNISLARRRVRSDDDLALMLDTVRKAAERAASLTQQLLTFSRGGEPVKRIASIGDLVSESASLILSGSRIKCNPVIPEDLWPVHVDINQISQVFNNIIINAKQAMPSGGTLSIEAHNIRDLPKNLPLPPGLYVSIAISDEGIGIPRENLDKIFDPYFTTKENGYGLGLASSYSIVKRHEGYLDVSSEPGKGTKFTIYLKASLARNENSTARQEKSSRFSGRLLIMDDEDFIIDTATGIFTHLGFEVTSAHDGARALALYMDAFNSGTPYDLVILDLTVPGGMGGKETLEHLRNVNPGVVAIVSSGYSDDAVISHYAEFGFKGMIRKPYTVEDVISALDTLSKVNSGSTDKN